MNKINVLKQFDGKLVVSSREIANNFGRQHIHVMESIRGLETSIENSIHLFIPSAYYDSYDREQKEYLLTRDGFTLLAMGFTGKKALEWKLKYIEAFNKMESALKSLTPESLTPEQIVANALIVANNIIQEKDRLLAEQKPKVLFADAVSTSHTSILVGELAKLINQNGVDIGQNRLFEWLRDNGFLIKRSGTDYNMPTQYSMDLGLFEIKERSITNPDGSVRITKTPKVTGKGQQYFINKFLS